MNLYARLLRVLLAALTAPKLAPMETSVVRMRTWPADVDVQRANNGRFVTMMDLGRMDYLCRTGILRVILRRGWQPLVAGVTIRYRRSLLVLRPFELHTRLLWWDARFVYFEQRFVQNGEDAAIALVRTALKDGQRTLGTEVLASAFGLPKEPPPCSEAIRLWSRVDEAMRSAPRTAPAAAA